MRRQPEFHKLYLTNHHIVIIPKEMVYPFGQISLKAITGNASASMGREIFSPGF